MQKKQSIFPKNNIVRIALVVGCILLIPLIMTIHDGSVEGAGWNWTLGDFIVMGTLLFATGLSINFVIKKLRNPLTRILTVTAIVATLLLIWVELAVEGVSKTLTILFQFS